VEAELRPFCGARRSSNYLFRQSVVLRVRVGVSKYEMRLYILLEYITYNMDISILLLGNRSNQSINLIAL
jgi:hypothetical protein